MLEPAIKYTDQLIRLQYNIWFNDKYKYWNNGVYYDTFEIDNTTWRKHQFVSVVNDEVLGYIGYDISHVDNIAFNLSILNFTDNKFAFAIDLGQALKDIFEKYKFRKLKFDVIIGNPMEKSYDKMIKKYGGRIVGISKDDVKLTDNNYYDRKSYEVLSEEYFLSVKSYEN